MSLQLASLFQDHAVLQRGQMLPVWGWATPFARVRVTLAGQEAFCISSAQGDFLVRLPAMPAGGPHTLRVELPGSGEQITLQDILIGEVWIGSGQSNMEWTLNQCIPLTKETIETADFPAIRMFNVQRRAHLGPHRTVGGCWQTATPEAAVNFSAVGFSFARRLHRELGVPVGVINASWGGTYIQTWISRSTLALNPATAGWLADYEAEAWTPGKWKEVDDVGPDGLVSKYPRDPGNTGLDYCWHQPFLVDSDWPVMNMPATWQSAGHRHSGVFWFRRTLEIPAEWTGRNLVLQLGAADKQDITYVNGVEVGRMGKDREEQYWNRQRCYTVPAALVTGKTLCVATRVYSFVYDGGLIGPATAMRVHPEGDPGHAVSLAGEWRYRCEHDLGPVVVAKIPGHGEPNSPHMLFDNMIRPLVPYALRGAIWYQGESNEEGHASYKWFQCDLVADWRRQWGHPELAFHVVQLPGFRTPQEYQDESRWARLREAQAGILELPHTGVAVIIELGEPDNIHPQDKVPVGERLVQSALVRTYGRPGPASGPFPEKFTITGNTIRVDFSDKEQGLKTTDGAAPRLFFLAGEDRKFHPAEARIEGGCVKVASAAVSRPVAVRYAWADNPEGANLANLAGLPAGSFRSDSW